MNDVKEKDSYTLEDIKKLDKELTFISITLDYIIKYIFANNIDIYKDFILSQIKEVINLDSKSTNINCVCNELGRSNHKEYNITIDSYAILNDNIHIDFECNRSEFENVKSRNIAYLNKIVTKTLEKGDNPNKLNRHIAIQLNLNANINDNKYGSDKIFLFGMKSNKIFSHLEVILVKNIEYYMRLFYNKGVKLPRDKMWLVVWGSKNLEQLYYNQVML